MEANHKLLQSNFKIAEQGIGGFWDFHHDAVSLDFEDTNRKYVMNDQYDQKKVRLLNNKDRLTLERKNLSNTYHAKTKEE